MTHHLDPSGLVGLARELWGAAPPVVLVSMGVASLEVGDRLSPIVEAAVPRAAEAVAKMVEEQSEEHVGTAGSTAVHEVSLVAELVEVAEARAGGMPVAIVRVRHATTIPEDVLRQAFDMLTETGPLAGAAWSSSHSTSSSRARAGSPARWGTTTWSAGRWRCAPRAARSTSFPQRPSWSCWRSGPGRD